MAIFRRKKKIIDIRMMHMNMLMIIFVHIKIYSRAVSHT